MAGKKHQNGRVPSGDKFMEGTSADDIEATLKKERYTRTHLPLLACIHYKSGKDSAWIADLLVMSRSTIDNWLSRMHRGGLDARYECERPDS